LGSGASGSRRAVCPSTKRGKIDADTYRDETLRNFRRRILSFCVLL
jgi:hypothetical protein